MTAWRIPVVFRNAISTTDFYVPVDIEPGRGTMKIKPQREGIMPDEDTVEIVVLKDFAGNYYALPRKGLEQARVSEEEKAEILRLIEQPANTELTDDQLESVTGGVTTIGTFRVSSSLKTVDRSHWG